VQQPDRGLDRHVGEQRRAVAAAFDEIFAVIIGLTHQCIDGVFERLLDHAVNDRGGAVRDRCRNAGMQDREVAASSA